MTSSLTRVNVILPSPPHGNRGHGRVSQEDDGGVFSNQSTVVNTKMTYLRETVCPDEEIVLESLGGERDSEPGKPLAHQREVIEQESGGTERTMTVEIKGKGREMPSIATQVVMAQTTKVVPAPTTETVATHLQKMSGKEALTMSLPLTSKNSYKHCQTLKTPNY